MEMIKLDAMLCNAAGKEMIDVEINNCICVVIDIIRATSTITTMLAGGAKRIFIAENKGHAYLLKSKNKGYLLCGEENGTPPKGFDYGNSPTEIEKLNLDGKDIILSTANGTASFVKVRKAIESYCLSLLNLTYTADLISKRLKQLKSDLLIVCSGQKGKIAYDDVYAAGLFIKELLARGLGAKLTDSVKIALAIALSENSHLNAINRSRSVENLHKTGLGPDIDFCANADRYYTGGLLKSKRGQLLIEKI